MEVDGGAAHLKQKSRPGSRDLSGGSSGIAVRNGGWSCSQGEEKDFYRSEIEEEMVVVSGVGVVGWWLG